RQVNKFGVSTYTPIRVLNLRSNAEVFAFPNPFTKNGLQIDLISNVSGSIEIALIDVRGKLIQEDKFEKGENPASFNLYQNNWFKPGIYFLQVKSSKKTELIRIQRTN
ncbi:MAG: T9SS type A sorting domain-containing protein, partial [Luteibaculum sp.]